MNYYTYNQATKTLALAERVIVRDGKTIILGDPADFARYLSAYPRAEDDPAPTPPDGKIAIRDGYHLEANEWRSTWRFNDKPPPTVADYDDAMEEHLREEREARGYTTREPDAYSNSTNRRWAQDARDWVHHRDEVMEFALELMNAVERGEREPPTLADFRASLPRITWSFADNG